MDLNNADLINFTSNLQSKISNDISMSGKSVQTLILYIGKSVEKGNWLWKEMNTF